MKTTMNSTFHRKWEPVDAQIKQSFEETGKQLEVSDKMKQQIDVRIAEESLKEERSMKHFNIKKVIVGVVAACLLVGTISVAASGLKNYVSHGSSIPDYRNFKELSKAEEEVGYTVDAIEDFSNGFTFKGIHISNTSMVNEANQEEEIGKELSIQYKKEKELIMYTAYRSLAGEYGNAAAEIADKILQCDDVTVAYMQITNKLVPPSYELTEEDKANMESGKYNIAFGSDEVKIQQSSFVYWVKDGITYELIGFELSLSADEMLHMAEEIITN